MTHRLVNASLTWIAALCFALPGCQDDGQSADAAVDGAAADTGPLKTLFGGARQVKLSVPSGYDAAVAYPLVVVLHGYSASGFIQSKLFGYPDLVEKEKVLLIAPDGTPDTKKKLFWDATDVCCNFYGPKVDDSGYLMGLINEISGVYNVDPKRIYLIGHSNGGFMAYRMACDHGDKIAAIISLAGATYADVQSCKPKGKVSVVQIHGEKDASVDYKGGSMVLGSYPGAVTTVETWAGYNGCSKTRKVIPPDVDLDSAIAGAESVVERMEGCPAGVDVELWTMKAGSHIPFPTATFTSMTYSFFKNHPRK